MFAAPKKRDETTKAAVIEIALLDVDGTLILQDLKKGEYINNELIDALLAAGITQCYLFSDMDLAEIVQKETIKTTILRAELIKKLESEGIKVLGVVTGADP